MAVARKSIVAKHSIRTGERLTEENFTAKRLGTGINPMRWNEVIGKIADRDYEAEFKYEKSMCSDRNKSGVWSVKTAYKKIQDDRELELQLVVTGMHLSPEFGLTYREIEQDGYEILERIEMLLSSDTANGITKSAEIGLIGFADVFTRLIPDVVLLLGDRYEMLVAATTAMIHRIPIAHIHGGELTLGAMDDAIRHSITKMGILHFASMDEYKKRII